MARWFTYKCKKCGYEVMTEPGGKYMLMSGEYQNYSCSNCREIVSVNISSTPLSESKPKCPECGSDSISKWNPSKCNCPKCNGKMQKVPDTVIFAD